MEELDTEKLVEEVDKVTGEEETSSESTTEEKPTEEKTSEEKSSEEEVSEDTTSLKSEEESSEEKEGKEEEKETDDTRFDKHPRWIKLRERAEAAEGKAKQAEKLEEAIGDMSTEELGRLQKAGGLLRKYPALAEKVQDVIDKHTYGNEETKGEIDSTKQEISDLRHEIALDKYDRQIVDLVDEHKVDKEIAPLVKEVLENRVMNQKLTSKQVPQAFEKALKDVNLAYRKKLASHIEAKKSEREVPASPGKKGKVIITKKESAEVGEVIDELAEGLKAHRGEPIKE